ncbi:MAG TPA: energy transducer TonB [Terriglobales bacterium]|jgi:TonB family protein
MYASDDLNFGLLPERKLNWRSIATSYGLEILFILLLVGVGVYWPAQIQVRRRYSVTDLVPPPSLTPEPVPIKLKTSRPVPVVARILPPAPIEAPKLTVPKELRAEAKPVVEAPKVTVNTFKPVVLEQTQTRQAKLLYTGSFGSAPTPTVNTPIQKIQTGGFGDPNGSSAQGKDAHLNVAKMGSFDAPQGQGTGNGTGGANGVKGTIASAGFGSGVAQPGQGNVNHAVQTGGFGSQEIAQAVRPQQVQAGPTTPVEITFKPNPVYTDEARQLRLQGEVLLEVMFGANSQLHVNRVVRGLGHGLDEAAIDAANKIRFKPAMQSGAATDSTAIVHVSFQMAF